jgi:hypothetical protein
MRDFEFVFRRPLGTDIRRSTARRIVLISVEEPPAQRPRLERQNAIDPVINSAVNLLEQLLNRLPPFDEKIPEVNMWKYVLRKSMVGDDWVCAICLKEGDVEGAVLHPGNCHIFHEACLQAWLHHKVSCPLCRKHVTPLLMILDQSACEHKHTD